MPGGQHQRIAGAAITGRLSAAAGRAAAQTYRDSFAEGATALRWEPYSLYGNGVVEGRAVEGASDGDRGIGVLRHEGGGPGTVSYALTDVFLNGTKLNERPLPAERVISDIANVDAGYAGSMPATWARQARPRRGSTTSSTRCPDRTVDPHQPPSARHG